VSASAQEPYEASILWERVDVPGHDFAALELEAAGPAIRGMAVFHDKAGPSALSYTVRCNHDWHTTEGHVRGRAGSRAVELVIHRGSDGRWSLNGAHCARVAGCIDLDLNFTPATNLLPLRRLALPVGDVAEVQSAWLEWPALTLRPLVQRYRRDTDAEYFYEADLPDAAPFRCILRVAPSGWVLDYGGLWRAQAGT
jgi:hypothetical protein